MRVNSLASTPFEEGKRAARVDPDHKNPHVDGSIEFRNYELGRQYGLRSLGGAGATFPVSRRSA